MWLRLLLLRLLRLLISLLCKILLSIHLLLLSVLRISLLLTILRITIVLLLPSVSILLVLLPGLERLGTGLEVPCARLESVAPRSIREVELLLRLTREVFVPHLIFPRVRLAISHCKSICAVPSGRLARWEYGSVAVDDLRLAREICDLLSDQAALSRIRREEKRSGWRHDAVSVNCLHCGRSQPNFSGVVSKS